MRRKTTVATRQQPLAVSTRHLPEDNARHATGRIRRLVFGCIMGLAAALSVSALSSCSGDAPDVTQLVFNSEDLSGWDTGTMLTRSVTLAAAGGRVEIPVRCNYDWHIVGYAPSWLTFEQLDGKPNQPVVVETQPNTSGARSCTLTLATGTRLLKITFEQERNVAAHPSVTTGDCHVYSTFASTKKVDFYFNVTHADLCSKAGIEVNGKQYPLTGFSEGFNSVTVEFSALSVSGYTYRAYCSESGTGKTYYGTTKTI